MTIAIDAGHGGADPGAVYEGRQEKDDVLRLAMTVGDILEKNGINVVYTRITDEYETPFKKATDANQAGADYFISFHRNSSVRPEMYDGFETLVYNNAGVKAEMAEKINENMAEIGFKNNGITERPNLVVLKRTQMPALLLEVGFINNSQDNELFDMRFEEIAQGIADGILDTLDYNSGASSRTTQSVNSYNDGYMPWEQSNVWRDENLTDRDDEESPGMMSPGMVSPGKVPPGMMPPGMMPPGVMLPGMMPPQEMPDNGRRLYRVQVGAYKNRESADRLLNSLLVEGFPAFIIMDDGLYKVQVGAFEMLANAIAMEERLRKYRYNTYITT